MSVYRLKSEILETGFQYLALRDESDVKRSFWFNGQSAQHQTNDVSVQLIEDERIITEDDQINDLDFLYFLMGGILVCSAKAWEQLKSLIVENVEVFHINCVNCRDREFYALNILSVVDCLDYSRSQVEHWERSGRVKRIQNWTFLPKCYGEKPIFKIPEWPLTDIFVTDAFKDIVEQNELKGLIFTEIKT